MGIISGEAKKILYRDRTKNRKHNLSTTKNFKCTLGALFFFFVECKNLFKQEKTFVQ